MKKTVKKATRQRGNHKKSMRVSAQKILELLEDRHAQDVFVAECKDGPTQWGKHTRLDGWAMKRSWAHPLSIGYEIKVSRADFLQDTKWHSYLDYCNEFYFVAPDGVLMADELGDTAGWLRVSSGGKRLIIEKRSAYREVVIPEAFYRYVLMARAVIGHSQRDVERAIGLRDAEYWEDWLARRGELKEIGYRVSRRLREKITREISEARDENRRLREEAERLTNIQTLLDRYGLNEHSYDLERQIAEVSKGVTPKLNNAARAIEQALAVIKKVMGNLEGNKP